MKLPATLNITKGLAKSDKAGAVVKVIIDTQELNENVITVKTKNNQTKVNIKELISHLEAIYKTKMGKLTFVDLRDTTGTIQFIIKQAPISFSKEIVIQVRGEFTAWVQQNPNLINGDIEIKVANLKVLSASYHELPFTISDHLTAK